MRRGGASPRDGDQLRIDLFHGVPWDGQSPRALTGEGSGVIFTARADHPREVMRGRFGQLELWPLEVPHREKSPRRTPGAPLLLPLPWEGDHE